MNTTVELENGMSVVGNDNGVAVSRCAMAKTTGTNSVAMGTLALADGIESVAFGNNAKATGDGSVARGSVAETRGAESAAIGGLYAVAKGEKSVAFGCTYANTEAPYSVAFAGGADAAGMGGDVIVSGERSVGVGIDPRQVSVLSPSSVGIAFGKPHDGRRELDVASAMDEPPTVMSPLGIAIAFDSRTALSSVVAVSSDGGVAMADNGGVAVAGRDAAAIATEPGSIAFAAATGSSAAGVKGSTLIFNTGEDVWIAPVDGTAVLENTLYFYDAVSGKVCVLPQ